MNIEKIKGIITLLENSSLQEIEITESAEKVRLSKYANRPVAAQQEVGTTVFTKDEPVNNLAVTTNESSKEEQSQAVQPKAEVASAEQIVIKSPMVGTFYRTSSPGAAPFVTVGDRVTKGQTVCIIEAMKTMNHLDSDEEGVVSKILVESGDMVEYDQPIIILEKK